MSTARRSGGSACVGVCFGGFPGTNRHMREIARATGALRHLVLMAGEPTSPEIAFFRDHLVATDPALVIFGSWHDAYEPLLAVRAERGRSSGVFWTSSAAQTDLSREADVLARLLRDPRVTHHFFASAEVATRLERAGKACFVLPHLVAAVPEPQALDRERAPDPAPPRITLFSSPNEYPRKNVLSCLLAVAGLTSPYRLQLNGLSQRPAYRALLEDLRIPYDDHGWMEDVAYAQAVGDAALGLQVSLAESFDYVAFDHFLRGVPVVVSPMVPCAHGLPESAERQLVVRNPDSPAEIEQRIAHLLASPAARTDLACIVREHATRLNTRHRELVAAALEAALGPLVR
jgi:hypothetical protein